MPWRLQTENCVAVGGRLGDGRPTSKDFQRPATISKHKYMSVSDTAF